MLQDDPASRSSGVRTGQEELWEFLSYAIWRIDCASGDEEYAEAFWGAAMDYKFKKDRHGTR